MIVAKHETETVESIFFVSSSTKILYEVKHGQNIFEILAALLNEHAAETSSSVEKKTIVIKTHLRLS